MTPWLMLLAACSREPKVGEAPVQPRDTDVSEPGAFYINPIAVGFEFDGVLQPNGSLEGYYVDGEYFPPVVYLVFASDEYFSASSEEVETEQYCHAWGTWEASPDASLTTWDGAELFYAYEGFLELEYYTCADLLDPDEWGEDGLDLIAAFQGMHLGLGFAPLTDDLRANWHEDVLEFYEPSMFSSYYAFNYDDTFIAEDLTSNFAWEYDSETESLAVDEFGYLLPVIVDDLSPPDVLPRMYVRSIASYYTMFDDLDLTALAEEL